MTISPGHGIKLDLPNYAPGLAVIPLKNPEEVLQYTRQKKSQPYRMALVIGVCMLFAACSNVDAPGSLEKAPSPIVKNEAPPVDRLQKKTSKTPRLAESTQGLTGFYKALANLESGARKRPVVVVHLGDSHIAADRFSGDLRAQLQHRFGDAGRGLVQPGKPFRYFHARGVNMQQTPGWKVANSRINPSGLYSLTGIRLEANSTDEILQLGVKKNRKRHEIEVEFLSGPDAGAVEINVGGKLHKLDLRSEKMRIHRFKVVAQAVTIKTLDARRVTVLGWKSSIKKPGLRYTSFGLPGATVNVMARWNSALVKDSLMHLKPDLIILGYGTNEGFWNNLKAAEYGRRYEKLVRKLQKSAGNPSLLVLGAPDSTRLPKYARKPDVKPGCKALRPNEIAQYSKLLAQKSPILARWHAPPGLARVRSAQKRAAKHLKAAFWDWSRVMGGACGTFRWAQAKPPLAYGDKVHFTDAGARRAAAALYKFLMTGYAQYTQGANRHVAART